MVVSRTRAATTAAVLALTACGLREDWVHPRHATDSDQYYVDREDCMRTSHKGADGFGEYWSRDRFAVCMQARGWRNP